MTIGYLLRRLGTFVLIVWITATINFVIPRLAPGDPMQAMLGRLEAQGGKVEDSAKLIAQYRQMFGLDEPIWLQYVKYLGAMARLNMGYSLTLFPVTVAEVIWNALPYTLGLLSVTTVISFVTGVLIGALVVWRGSSKAAKMLFPALMVVAPIPYYLLAMLLMFLLAFTFRIFPHTGITAFGRVATGSVDLRYALDVVYHSILPALSIILASMGGWAVGMRGMMVTIQGEDYLTLAEAKGLKGRWIFFRYAMRNAMLPQLTGLAISLGHVVSGATLVEVIFGYPGVGFSLVSAITSADYSVMQGITFILVVSVAGAVIIIDLLYPKLDPRITYARR